MQVCDRGFSTFHDHALFSVDWNVIYAPSLLPSGVSVSILVFPSIYLARICSRIRLAIINIKVVGAGRHGVPGIENQEHTC
ncbi:hypothetical protein BJX64DRAFT_68347 [Aspergillus heterothallicus]